MSTSTNLGLPYIAAAQAQKHVTHNEAIRALDAIVQLSVADRDLAAPPLSPAEGDHYIIAASPTGDWAGKAGQIAAFQDGGWLFYAPQTGWRAWVADEAALVVFDGAAWVVYGGGSGGGSGGGVASVNPVALVGINATADTSNRLAVASPAALFNHEGAGHQIKINKATSGDTASVLFQAGFSGRAEFGLAGSDDWSVKVSADGAAWNDVLVADRATGRVRFPNTPSREVLTADRMYYVRTDGNDSNDGLANSAGRAFASIQKALDVVAALDLATFTATISVAAGSYAITAPLTYRGFQGGQVILQGQTAPSPNPNTLALTGVLADDQALVEAAFPVRVTASTAIVMLDLAASFGLGTVQNLAFIQTGAHTTAVVQPAKILPTALTRCAVFGGGGIACNDGGQLTMDFCLAAHSRDRAINLNRGSVLVMTNGQIAHALGRSIDANDWCALRLNAVTLHTVSTAQAVFASRGVTVYVLNCTFNGGLYGLLLEQSTAYVQSTTFAVSSIVARATVGSSIRFHIPTISGAATGIQAFTRSYINVTGTVTGTPAYSPAFATIGNNESFISG